jgi:hypothetical protein
LSLDELILPGIELVLDLGELVFVEVTQMGVLPCRAVDNVRRQVDEAVPLEGLLLCLLQFPHSLLQRLVLTLQSRAHALCLFPGVGEPFAQLRLPLHELLFLVLACELLGVELLCEGGELLGELVRLLDGGL